MDVWVVIIKISAICGIILFLSWLAERQLAFIKWLENRRMLKKKKLGEPMPYLDGLTKLHPKKKNILLNEALKARKQYKHETAIMKFKLLLGQASDDSERCAILNLIGASQIRSSDYKNAEQTFLEMITIAEQAKLDEALSAALGNIGLVYRTLGEPRKALDYHQKALEIDEKIGSLEGQANQLGNIGIVYEALGEPRKAL
ncbi:MAG: tetratricopeptide repeat protein, partial [Candidatus Stahlbacteria bacterium]